MERESGQTFCLKLDKHNATGEPKSEKLVFVSALASGAAERFRWRRPDLSQPEKMRLWHVHPELGDSVMQGGDLASSLAINTRSRLWGSLLEWSRSHGDAPNI